MMKKSGIPKPPLSNQELEQALKTLFSATDTRVLLRAYRALNHINTRMDQAVKLFKIAKEEMQLKITIRSFANALSVDSSDLSKKLSGKCILPHGRPSVLTPDEEEELLLYIICCYEIHKPCTPKKLVEYISEQFSKTVSRSWYRYFIEKHKDKILQSVAYPQESSRIRLTKEAALKHVKNLEKYVVGTPDELVFNLDEVGCQQWADKKTKHCLVPIECKGQRVEYEVQRNEKRITLIVTISMAGDVLTPLMVTHRKTIDNNVKPSGIREVRRLYFA